MPLYATFPFILLLLLIAVGPLWFHDWWERNYPRVSVGLGLAVSAAMAVFANDGLRLVGIALVDYAGFIALVGSLYVISGGIRVKFEGQTTAAGNTAMLAFGGLLANVIGTTGASMFLIRPFLRMNRKRLAPFHVVFFIFIVSNIGGGLTPIGDPPLFLGYLKGIPFFWVLENAILPWAIVMVVTLALFYIFDHRHRHDPYDPEIRVGVDFGGMKQMFYLAVIVALVLLQSARMFHRLPHAVVSLGAAALMGGTAWLSHRGADRRILNENDFNFHPLREVAFLFAGIFLTMVPALEYLQAHAKTMGLDEAWQFFFATGSLSAFLDNAPTYLTFLSIALGLEGHGINDMEGVRAFIASDNGGAITVAISLGAVFFGAMTYIGNGPNFMVRTIAKHAGAPAPDFATYLFKYAIPILLPVFGLAAVLLQVL